MKKAKFFLYQFLVVSNKVCFLADGLRTEVDAGLLGHVTTGTDGSVKTKLNRIFNLFEQNKKRIIIFLM